MWAMQPQHHRDTISAQKGKGHSVQTTNTHVVTRSAALEHPAPEAQIGHNESHAPKSATEQSATGGKEAFLILF